MSDKTEKKTCALRARSITTSVSTKTTRSVDKMDKGLEHANSNSQLTRCSSLRHRRAVTDALRLLSYWLTQPRPNGSFPCGILHKRIGQNLSHYSCPTR